MLTLYHAPLTRSVRIYWLLEELGIPYRLETVTFTPPRPPLKPFAQQTPFGKLPAIRDGDVAMFESGAIVEWVLERYGDGRLVPAAGTPERAAFLQWVHFAEATAFAPLANIAWHTFKDNGANLPPSVEDYRMWAAAAFETLERALEGRDYLLGAELSGADVMMGFTVQCAQWFGLLDEHHPNVNAYLARLATRPAFQKAFGR